jgi:hypothetical protein
METKKLEPVDGDFGWDCDDVTVKPFKQNEYFVKCHLVDPIGNGDGYYTARLVNGELCPDPTGDQPDPFNPKKVYVEPGSSTWDKMVAYIRHKIRI